MTESNKFAFLYYIQSYPTYTTVYYDELTHWMKIPLIKAWRGIFGDGLRDSKDEVEELHDKNYFVENKRVISKPLGLMREYPGWTLTDKAIEFIDEMISIDEIAVEIIKWRLLSGDINDYQSVNILAKNVFKVWGE